MTTTHTFPSESGQAVLLPPDMAYGDHLMELNIVRDGDIIMLYPAQPVAPRMSVAALPCHPRLEPVREVHAVEAPKAEPVELQEAQAVEVREPGPVEVLEHAWD